MFTEIYFEKVALIGSLFFIGCLFIGWLLKAI